MAASPVYGKQYIRFAETGLASDAITAPLEQFSLVKIAAGGTEPPTIETATSGGAIFGVLQQEIPVVDEEKATTLPRLGTVATSGLLLVVADGANLQAQGDALLCSNGKSSSAGAAVTCNNTAPTVRQVVTIGNVQHVMVSFS